MIPRIALTPGEPAGIGPDILISVAQQRQSAALVAFADPNLLLDRARKLGLPLNLREWQASSPRVSLEPSCLWVAPYRLRSSCTAGKPDPDNIPYVLDTLHAAAEACMKKNCDALVTGPVNKGLFRQAGVNFSGHTEFLAEKTQSSQVVMMLSAPPLRIALATTHLPLREVPRAITTEHLRNVIMLVNRELSRLLKKPAPALFVLGLNPHAGDNGALGQEEIDIIIPVLNSLRESGLNITGPLSADTAFTPHNRTAADIFIAMYHDQGLPVLKTLGFGNAINITLGLNILRTSVDHGTAYDLAGTGKAKADSMQLAIHTAINFSNNIHHP